MKRREYINMEFSFLLGNPYKSISSQFPILPAHYRKSKSEWALEILCQLGNMLQCTYPSKDPPAAQLHIRWKTESS
jgi:hypothetical protein